MAYSDRDWDNTGTKVTKEDFKRIEKGIKANDTAITANTNQINVLSGESLRYLGEISTLPSSLEHGCYTISSCMDGTIPIQFGTLTICNKGSEKTMNATGFRNDVEEEHFATYNNNTGTWKWIQIATTTKTSFLCTPVTGYTIIRQNCYEKGGIAYFNIFIKLTSGDAFVTNAQLVVATIPTTYRPATLYDYIPVTTQITTTQATGNPISGCLHSDGNIYIQTSVQGTIVSISGEVVL